MAEAEARKTLGGESSMDTIELRKRLVRVEQRRKCEEFRKAALDLAIFQYHRMWLNFDGPVREMIKKNNGKLSCKIIGLIASEYNIGRTVKLIPDDDITCESTKQKVRDKNLSKICNKFKKSAKKSRSLVARANTIKNIAKSIHKTITLENCKIDSYKKQGENRDKYLPVSYASKLSWFFAPDDWTVFDNYVANAMGAKGNAKSGETSASRMINYYKKLQCAGFQGVVNRVSVNLAAAKLSYLPAERIIDIYLWAFGADMDSFCTTWKFAMCHKAVLDESIADKLQAARNDMDWIATECALLPIPAHG